MSQLGSLRSGPLGVRSFRLLAGGQFASTIGDYCYAVALPWLVLSSRGRASTWAFAIDAASFAVSALTLALIPRRPAEGSVIAAATGISEIDEAADRMADGGVLALLRRSRALQVILVVVIAANLAGGGMSEVALPSLAHAQFGAVGYGALLACFAVGAVIGTLAAARTGGLRRPAIFASVVFLVEAAAIALTPYLGGEAGAAAMLFVTGAANGLGNVTFLTVLQKWAPPALLGRVMSALMLCAFGSFPLSVAISGVLVRHIGPSLFFPIAGALVAAAILGGLTQREFREFGAVEGARRGPDSREPTGARRRAPASQTAWPPPRATGARPCPHSPASQGTRHRLTSPRAKGRGDIWTEERRRRSDVGRRRVKSARRQVGVIESVRPRSVQFKKERPQPGAAGACGTARRSDKAALGSRK